MVIDADYFYECMGSEMMPRILAIDPGQERIGLAISDPSGTIASPLSVLQHISRLKDVEAIVEIAVGNEAKSILVGVALDDEGRIGPQARKALRLVEVLRENTDLPILIWDESGSTQSARRTRKPDPLLDARAAAVILQDYLDAQKN
jgi:putative Holliday junction resolvase